MLVLCFTHFTNGYAEEKVVSNKSHISDELVIWLKGNFTYVAADGTATDLSGQTYISLPGGVPHAVKCGKEPCVLYLRYSRPFDYFIHPMPANKK
jgi:hypothetical protein